MNKKLQMVIGILVIALVIMACGSTTQATKIGEATGIPTSAPASTQYKIGDIIQIGNLTMTVNGISSPSGDQFNQPDSGKKFVVVDVTFENKGSDSENISSMLQMSLKDDTGQAYDEDITATVASGGKTPDGEIAAGEKLRGQIGFQIPTDAKGLQFVYDASILGSGKVFVDLGQ